MKLNVQKTLVSGFLCCLSMAAAQAQTERVYFVTPKDGAKVESTFDVKFGVSGKIIGPLGDMSPNLGHHHLIIDSKPVAKGASVPFDEAHMHFGKGQTETSLTLPPGKHTLTLQFGNGAHQSYGPEMSQTITVMVNSPKAAATQSAY